MNKIEIKKRSSEEVACWHVEAEGVTPNTVLSAEKNITLLVKVDGIMKVQIGGACTVYSLLNPGKNTKLFGGNKPYENVEIYALDQSSEFNAEWGLAGDMAMPCRDSEHDVDCEAIAFGEYYYKIANFVNFFNTIPMDKKGEITRDAIREYLRGETTGVIKSYLTSMLNKYDIKACQAKLAEFSEEIKEKINAHLELKGLSVYNFVIARLSYNLRHKAIREQIDNEKLKVAIKKIGNEGRLDDVTVDRAKADIAIDIIKAEKGASIPSTPTPKTEEPVTYVYCSRCGEKNISSNNYCNKCGEKLHK